MSKLDKESIGPKLIEKKSSPYEIISVSGVETYRLHHPEVKASLPFLILPYSNFIFYKLTV